MVGGRREVERAVCKFKFRFKSGQPGDGRSEMGDGEDMNLERNGCGVICEVNGLNEALGRMLRFSDEQLDKMGRKGKKMVTERFSWKAAAEAMVDGYKEIGVRR